MFEIGSSLREARERRRIEFAQAEVATKIRCKYLRALEDEQFELLPSQTYVKGFLRAYAEYLGLDGQLYVDEYNSRFVPGEESEVRARRSSSRPQRRNRRLETAVVLGVLGIVAVATLVVISAWTSSGHQDATRRPAHRAAPARKPHVTPVPGLAITARSGPSYVAVHRGGPTGEIAFQGTIERGQTVPLSGARFWVNVSSPENLLIKVRGRRIEVGGYRPQVIWVTPSGWRTG